jgi:hypothetical protein
MTGDRAEVNVATPVRIYPDPHRPAQASPDPTAPPKAELYKPPRPDKTPALGDA